MQWFCSLEGHEFLLPLDRAFLQDKFNMVGLHTACEFPKDRVRKCMLLLMSKQQPSEEDLKDEQFLMLNQDTSDLYGVLHARYIRSREGKCSFGLLCYWLTVLFRAGSRLRQVSDWRLRILPAGFL